nr:hypothetical protein [Angustibacter aerolatus]
MSEIVVFSGSAHTEPGRRDLRRDRRRAWPPRRCSASATTACRCRRGPTAASATCSSCSRSCRRCRST